MMLGNSSAVCAGTIMMGTDSQTVIYRRYSRVSSLTDPDDNEFLRCTIQYEETQQNPASEFIHPSRERERERVVTTS